MKNQNKESLLIHISISNYVFLKKLALDNGFSISDIVEDILTILNREVYTKRVNDMGAVKRFVKMLLESEQAHDKNFTEACRGAKNETKK